MSTVTDYLEIATSGTGLIHAASGYYVQLRSQTGGGTYTSVAVTDSTGYYTLTGVPPDSYELWYSKNVGGPWTDSKKTQYVPGTRLWFDVVAYAGADSTGVANAAPAINTTLTAAAGISPVYIPPGTYLIGTQLSLPSNTTLLMHPQAKLLRTFSGSSTIINSNISSGNSNITVIGGTLGLGAARPAGQHLAFGKVTGLRVQDCWIGDTTGAYMLWLWDCSNVVITGCILNNPATGELLNDGIHVNNGHHISIANCFVSTGDDAIVLGNQGDSTGAGTVTLHDVVVSNCTAFSGGSRAVSIYTEINAAVYGVEINNVAGTGNGGQTLEIHNYFSTSQALIHDIHLSNCRFTSPAASVYAGIVQYATRVSLHQMDFPAQSINVNNCTDITLSECHASYHAAAGDIVELNTVTGLNIRGGVFDGAGSSGNGIMAISVTGGSWVGVTVRDCTTANANLNNSTGLRILGCNFSNVTTRNAGIFEQGTSDFNRVENCDLRGNTFPAYLGTSGGGIAHSRYAGNIGYNPKGKGFTNPSQPAVAATNTAVTNNTGADCQVFVTNPGAAAVTISIGGSAITGFSIAASTTSAPIRVPAGQTITLTYTSTAPTWQWVGD